MQAREHSHGKLNAVSTFDVVLVLIFLVLIVVMVYPFWHCIIGSLISQQEYMSKSILLWPNKIVLDAYKYVFEQGKIFGPLATTAIITVIGTICNVFFVSWMAYGMSKKYPGSSLVAMLVILTMFVSAGLIPNYLLYRQLGLLNRIAVYILPSLINTFYLIVLRTNFAGFPTELEDAAHIDGAGEFKIFFQFVLPLNLPILATITLFTAVDYWNTYEASVFFVTNSNIKTLQNYLQMIMGSTSDTIISNPSIFTENIRLANTVIAILPIMLVYPFLQKYFTSGMMIGAIKG